MSGFITKFNQELGHGVAATQLKLEALKRVTDGQIHKARQALGEHLEKLDVKIHQTSEKLEAVEDSIDDWVFQKSEDMGHDKDERKSKKLLERAAYAQRRSERAFSKSLHAIDKAEREMLRSKIAHADAGIPNPERKKIVLN